DADALRHRLSLPLHARRLHRPGAFSGADRHPAPGHLLRRGALPLRDGGGRDVLGLRRHLFLAAEVDRQDVQRDARPVALLADADLLQHDLLRAALPRHGRHAAAHPGLPADVRDLEPDLVDRRLRLRARAVHFPLQPVHYAQERRAGGAEAVGRRGLDRLDASADAAAVPLVRNAARSEVMGQVLLVSKNAETALILATIALAFCFG